MFGFIFGTICLIALVVVLAKGKKGYWAHGACAGRGKYSDEGPEVEAAVGGEV